MVRAPGGGEGDGSGGGDGDGEGDGSGGGDGDGEGDGAEVSAWAGRVITSTNGLAHFAGNRIDAPIAPAVAATFFKNFRRPVVCF